MNSVPASASRLAVLVVDDIDTSRQALAQRQRRNQDNILDAVIAVDDARTIVDANLDACRTFDTDEPSCLQGSHCDAVFGADLAVPRAGGDLTLRRAVCSEFPARIGIRPGRSWRCAPRPCAGRNGSPNRKRRSPKCRSAARRAPRFRPDWPRRDAGEPGTRLAIAK